MNSYDTLLTNKDDYLTFSTPNLTIVSNREYEMKSAKYGLTLYIFQFQILQIMLMLSFEMTYCTL